MSTHNIFSGQNEKNIIILFGAKTVSYMNSADLDQLKHRYSFSFLHIPVLILSNKFIYSVIHLIYSVIHLIYSVIHLTYSVILYTEVRAVS